MLFLVFKNLFGQFFNISNIDKDLVMLKSIILILSLLLLAPDCSGPVTQKPVQPKPTPIVTDTEQCDLAQINLLRLRCPEGNPTKKGKTFSDFCKETQNNGIFLNPKCLATLTDCSQIDSCTNSK